MEKEECPEELSFIRYTFILFINTNTNEMEYTSVPVLSGKDTMITRRKTHTLSNFNIILFQVPTAGFELETLLEKLRTVDAQGTGPQDHRGSPSSHLYSTTLYLPHHSPLTFVPSLHVAILMSTIPFPSKKVLILVYSILQYRFCWTMSV